jgi:hypothetical protein
LDLKVNNVTLSKEGNQGKKGIKEKKEGRKE